MNLSRSTYYHKPKNDSGDDLQLINRIEAIIEEFSGYGYRRVTLELRRRGDPSNSKKVLRIMRERGLIRKLKRQWIQTTYSNHSHRIYPNLVQNLAITGPNQVWAADITYIAIQCGFVYLAVILDLFAGPWAMLSPRTSIPRFVWKLSAWPLRLVIPRRGSSITPIAVSSMPLTTTLRCCRNTPSGSAWPIRETPMTMLPPRTS